MIPRRWRWPLTVVAVLLVGTVTVAMMLGTHSDAGTLDPESASADGGLALASLLHDRGLQVTTARTTAEAVGAVRASGQDTTLLVTDPGLLGPSQLTALAAQPVGRLVLLGADEPTLTTLVGPGVEAWDQSGVTSGLLDPACPDPDAQAAGNADVGGSMAYFPNARNGGGSEAGCYPFGGTSSGFSDSYAMLSASGPESSDIVLLGSRAPFENAKLADHGNAALALRVLGKHTNVVWYLPDTSDPAAAVDRHKGFSDVIPAGWRWATLQLAIAALLLAVWQARRLGPAVVEHLPVVVRAAETVEGRARLYERGKVRDRAADALREAARDRLTRRLGLPRAAMPGDIATALAARGGRPAVDTVQLLAGPAPADDQELVRLAAALDGLEAEVGRL